jgi:hypothetical protein
MSSTQLELVIELAAKSKFPKIAESDMKDETKFPSASIPVGHANLDEDDANGRAEDIMPGSKAPIPAANHDDWQDNEDMHAMGVTIGPAGDVMHGSMQIGNIVTVPKGKNRYIGIHHPSGALTDAHSNRARAAMELRTLHHFLPHHNEKGAKAHPGMCLSNQELSTVIALAAKNKERTASEGMAKYGDVEYADPKNKAYPINNAERVRAAWGYINHPDNAAKYPRNGVSLESVKAKIKSAAKKFGVEISDN